MTPRGRGALGYRHARRETRTRGGRHGHPIDHDPEPAGRGLGARPPHTTTSRTVDADPAGTDRVTTVQAGVAWIVREVTHVPGVLRLRGERLSFDSTRGLIFDEDLADLGLSLGWTGRGGFRATVRGERLRLQVVRPAGAVATSGELVERLTADAPTTWGDAAAWSVWRGLLAPAGDRRRPGVMAPEWRSARARPAS